MKWHDHRRLCAADAPPTRRDVLRLAAGGAGAVVLTGCSNESRCEDTAGSEEVAGEHRVADSEMEDAKETVEKAYRLGHEYEKQYGGCAQCTLAALQDAVPFLAKDVNVFRAASALDGGATPTGLQNCGSFTGAGMAIGSYCGRSRKGEFEGTTRKAHDLIRKLYRHFEEHYGSVLCKDVREKAEKNCPEVVGLAAKWTAQILADEFHSMKGGEAESPPVPAQSEKQ